MIIAYEAKPLPEGWCYYTRTRWVPELDDYVMLTFFDPVQIAPYISNPDLAHLQGEMLAGSQCVPAIPPAPRLRLVS